MAPSQRLAGRPGDRFGRGYGSVGAISDDLATELLEMALPVILSPDQYDHWLDPAFENQQELQSLMQPYEGDDLVVTAVSTIVNSPANDGPACIEPHAEWERGDRCPALLVPSSRGPFAGPQPS